MASRVLRQFDRATPSEKLSERFLRGRALHANDDGDEDERTSIFFPNAYTVSTGVTRRGFRFSCDMLFFLL